MNVETEEIAM